MHLSRPLMLAALLAAPALGRDDALKVEPLPGAPPATLAAPVKESLAATGYKVLDGQGKPFAEIWLRKALPASAKPSGTKGTILFPLLAEGELLGVLRFVAEGHDYRDQAIAPGVYTLRYGLQPVNGAHLGVSETRDYAMLLPAAQDQATTPLTGDKLATTSAEAAGSSHPAVLLMLAAPSGAKEGVADVAHDDAKNTTGVVLPITLAVKGESAPSSLLVQIVVVGMAAN